MGGASVSGRYIVHRCACPAETSKDALIPTPSYSTTPNHGILFCLIATLFPSPSTCHQAPITYDDPSSIGQGRPAISNVDILRLLVQFVDEDQFFFFAPVSRAWRTAWEPRPTVTSWVTSDSSVSQLRESFECGLPRDNVHLCTAIVRLGNLELLQHARAAGCPWDPATCISLAGSTGNLGIVDWAWQNGCSWHEDVCSLAAKGGHVDVLQFARRHGCPWNQFTCSSAAGGSHLDVLKWARLNGCPWDAGTCAAAAGKGNLAVIQWARENGCAWDERTCFSACWGGHLEVLKWARSRGCPWDHNACLNAARMKQQLHVLSWLRAVAVSHPMDY